MKHTKVALAVAIPLFLACLIRAQEPAPAQAEFLNRISKAYLQSDLDTIIKMTNWSGVSPSFRTKAIDKYKRQVALTATNIELLDKNAAKWSDWKQGDTVFTYNADVSHTLVVHLQPGSKIQLRFGEVPIKDLRLPVGLVDGKFYLLRGIPKQAEK